MADGDTPVNLNADRVAAMVAADLARGVLGLPTPAERWEYLDSPIEVVDQFEVGEADLVHLVGPNRTLATEPGRYALVRVGDIEGSHE